MTTDTMTLDEAAGFLKVKYHRAAELARLKILPHYRLGRQIRISRAQLQAFIERGGQGLPGVWKKQV
jgi:excisionase family DNA binding protein